MRSHAERGNEPTITLAGTPQIGQCNGFKIHTIVNFPLHSFRKTMYTAGIDNKLGETKREERD